LAHVDKNNQPTTKFCGYKVKTGGKSSRGKQANPYIVVNSETYSLCVGIENFWQTFPNSLEVHDNKLIASPFPIADDQIFELQGGEKAISRIWLSFDNNKAIDNIPILPALAPIIPSLLPEWYCQCNLFPHISPESPDKDDSFFFKLTSESLNGKNSFDKKNIKFDEFGWRNFGDFPADHELQYYSGDKAFVSHYNNQYDYILVLLNYFVRSNNPKWFTLARNYASHFIHHDLYHTQKDRSVYNGGSFWHTRHYVHAGTATHRAYSKLAMDWKKVPKWFGGGPSNEHNYSSGLLLYFLLTGDQNANESIFQLYNWVTSRQDGTKTLLRFISSNPTGLSTCTRNPLHQGLGRGGAYSINTCLDAYVLSGKKKYLITGEKFIRVCCHPDENPDDLNLLNREDQWSYTVFLQLLGKYLDIKHEQDDHDDMFFYARDVLITIVDWMIDNEFPYLDKPSDLEYPTSTWAAQDLRKICVFLYAAIYGRKSSYQKYTEKAKFYFEKSKSYLKSFNDSNSIRNMVLIMNCVPFYFFFSQNGLQKKYIAHKENLIYKKRIKFIPQRVDALNKIKKTIFFSFILTITATIIILLILYI